MRSIGTQIGFSSLLDPYRYNVGRPDRRSFFILVKFAHVWHTNSLETLIYQQSSMLGGGILVLWYKIVS